MKTSCFLKLPLASNIIISTTSKVVYYLLPNLTHPELMNWPVSVATASVWTILTVITGTRSRSGLHGNDTESMTLYMDTFGHICIVHKVYTRICKNYYTVCINFTVPLKLKTRGLGNSLKSCGRAWKLCSKSQKVHSPS